MRQVAIGLTTILMTGAAAAQNLTANEKVGSYFCKITAAGGIQYDLNTKQWISARFNTEDSSYLISIEPSGIVGEEGLFKMRVGEFENASPGRFCADPTTHRQSMPISGLTICQDFGSQYFFDTDTLKFQIMFEGGYVYKELNADTPFIAVGQCKKIG